MPFIIRDQTLLPNYLRVPFWRWLMVLHGRAAPSNPPEGSLSDPLIMKASRFYKRVCEEGPGGMKRCQQYWPAIFEAYTLFGGGRGESVWRSVMEALLLTELEFDEIPAALDIPGMTTEGIRTYHALFFDVRGYMQSEVAIHTNVLATSSIYLDPGQASALLTYNDNVFRARKRRQKLQDQLIDQGIGMQVAESLVPRTPDSNAPVGHVDLMRRMFAWHWGAGAFLDYFYGRGGSASRTHKAWAREWLSESLTRSLCSAASGQRSLYREDVQELFKLAQKNWAMPEESGYEVEEEIRAGFLHDAVQVLDRSLQEVDRLRAEEGVRRLEAIKRIMG